MSEISPTNVNRNDLTAQIEAMLQTLHPEVDPDVCDRIRDARTRDQAIQMIRRENERYWREAEATKLTDQLRQKDSDIHHKVEVIELKDQMIVQLRAENDRLNAMMRVILGQAPLWAQVAMTRQGLLPAPSGRSALNGEN